MRAFPASVPCLPYATARALIQSGDILLCSGSSPISRMIQDATDSVWSHVGFVLREDIIQRILLLESVESIGVRCGPLRQYVSDYNGTGTGYPGRVFLARHQALAAHAANLISFSQGAIDLLNYRYDLQELFEIAARIVAAKVGGTPQPLRTNRTYTCIEYVALCFASLGIDIPADARGFRAPRDVLAMPEISVWCELEVEHA